MWSYMPCGLKNSFSNIRLDTQRKRLRCASDTKNLE